MTGRKSIPKKELMVVKDMIQIDSMNESWENGNEYWFNASG